MQEISNNIFDSVSLMTENIIDTQQNDEGRTGEIPRSPVSVSMETFGLSK